MITVDLYEGKTSGLALDPARPRSLEDEIHEHELIAQRDAAARLDLPEVVKTCDRNLLRLRIGHTLGFPLLSNHECSVWKHFLPTTYSSKVVIRLPASFSFTASLYSLLDYQFDTPPLSVLETWQGCKDRKLFDVYEIWTPERPQPEPILVGYKSDVGPFLIAQWGESLRPFEEIEKEVNAGTDKPTMSNRALQTPAILPSGFVPSSGFMPLR